MDLTNELYDEIDDFLNKRMATAQEAAFRQRLAQDDELRREVAMQQLMNQGLEAAALKQQLKTIRQGVRRQRITRRTRQAIIAALMVVLTGTGYWLYERAQPLMPDAAFEAYYKPAPLTRADLVLPGRLAQARTHYYAGSYVLALNQLASLPADSLRLAPYYRGLTLLALNRPREAVQALTTAQQSPDPDTRQQAEWYMALAYLRANDVGAAKQTLTAIVGVPEHPYRDLAIELLDKLA